MCIERDTLALCFSITRSLVLVVVLSSLASHSHRAHALARLFVADAASLCALALSRAA